MMILKMFWYFWIQRSVFVTDITNICYKCFWYEKANFKLFVWFDFIWLYLLLFQPFYGNIVIPPSPLVKKIKYPEQCLENLLIGYDVLEEHLGYKFKDRSYLLQAMTHASYSPNRLTDCYQRLEFLGDAVLGN